VTSTTQALNDLESKLAAGAPFTRADAERIAACADLVSVGVLGEAARRAIHGDRVTFGRVTDVAAGQPADPGEAGEVRLIGRPGSVEEARQRVRAGAARASGVPLTGFTLADLNDLAGGDHLAVAELARVLRAEGLESLADVPLDQVGDTENALELLRAVVHGGLGAWRATVHRAAGDARLDLIERAARLHAETGAFRAFAPLPRVDPSDAPSTGYDDVKTIAMARLLCAAIPSIQVDWTLYGPKLAQVSIAYGADDLDAVPPVGDPRLGHRRSPREDLERQIRAAFAEPAERNGRYELLA
jgi:aminodeoxyfutalosine synthase